MVWLTNLLFKSNRGVDKFWRKRKIFRLSAHYIGRKRNCHNLAIRNVHRALVFATKARTQRYIDYTNLWQSRINAACLQYNVHPFTFKEGLDRIGVRLDKKNLANLAALEPQSFAALTSLAKDKLHNDGLNVIMDDGIPRGIDLKHQLYLRGKLNKQ